MTKSNQLNSQLLAVQIITLHQKLIFSEELVKRFH